MTDEQMKTELRKVADDMVTEGDEKLAKYLRSLLRGNGAAVYQILTHVHSASTSWEDVTQEMYERAHSAQRRVMYTAPQAECAPRADADTAGRSRAARWADKTIACHECKLTYGESHMLSDIASGRVAVAAPPASSVADGGKDEAVAHWQALYTSMRGELSDQYGSVEDQLHVYERYPDWTAPQRSPAMTEHDAKGLEIIAGWLQRDGLIEPAAMLRRLAAGASERAALAQPAGATPEQIRAYIAEREPK